MTEYTEGRVSVREADSRVRVLRDDLPGVNGTTIHGDRIFVDECRIGRRVLELFTDGRPPHTLVGNVPPPNALAVSPDGMLCFPVIGTGEIWRVGLDDGAVDRVAGDLAVPDAVKFDARDRIVSRQGGTGEVMRIDIATGRRSVLATLDPCLDNLSFAGERPFVSKFDGSITKLLGDGKVRPLLPVATMTLRDWTALEDWWSRVSPRSSPGSAGHPP